MNSTFKMKHLCLTAVFMALTMITTMYIQIPIPLGYANLGNSVIMVASFFFGPATGLIAGGVGSALADFLTGYPMWCLPTFIIKSVMGLVFYYIARGGKKNPKVLSIRTALACLVVIVWATAGYTISGCILYGGLEAGLASTPGLAMEGVLHIVLFYLLAFPLEKAKIYRFLPVDSLKKSAQAAINKVDSSTSK